MPEKVSGKFMPEKKEIVEIINFTIFCQTILSTLYCFDNFYSSSYKPCRASCKAFLTRLYRKKLGREINWATLASDGYFP